MTTGELLLATGLKILFILAVVVGAFAPALVWAERRQSAMIQDRVGPSRADLPLGKFFPAMLAGMKALMGPLKLGVTACVAGAIALLMLAGAGMLSGTSVLVVGNISEPLQQQLLDHEYDLAIAPNVGAVNAETLGNYDVAYVVNHQGDALRTVLTEQGLDMPIHTVAEPEALSAIASTSVVAGASMVQLFIGIIGLFLLAGVLNAGYKFHRGFVESGGRIYLKGLLHPAADAMKMIWKEDFVPPKADKLLHSLAPIITVIPAIASFAVIPFADTLFLDHWDQILPRDLAGVVGPAVPMQVASLNVGVLFIFAIAGTGVIGAAIGGYASDNKYSLMGGIRAASQMVSYEVALGLTIVPCFMLYGTVRLEEMAFWQHEHVWGLMHPPLFIAMILYLASAIAETKRVPFDAPEGESELVGGYLTEYSGMKFGMFFTGEFVEVVALSGLAAVFFLGGWDIPFLFRDGLDFWGTWEMAIPLTDLVFSDRMPIPHALVLAIQVVVFLVKIVFLVWLQLMIRWTLPRFRYDQIMALCWKGILPLALINILFTGIYVLLFGL